MTLITNVRNLKIRNERDQARIIECETNVKTAS